MAPFLTLELAVTLPDRTAVLVVGVPELGAKEPTAILADQLSGENAFAGIGTAQRFPSGKLRLYMIPLVRLDNRWMPNGRKVL